MFKRQLYRIFCGFFLGLSVVAPGFSGSVIAIVMGIYKDLIRIASNPFKKLKENIIFCIPLGIGAVVSAVLFVISFGYLFENYAKATYLLFVGLVVGNLPMIYKEVKKEPFKKHYFIGGAIAFAAALVLAVFAPLKSGDATTLTASLIILAISGFAGGAAALMPGMSVSVILIIFGVYDQVIAGAGLLLKRDFTVLLPLCVFGTAAVIGIVLSSKLIKIGLDKFPGFANTTIFGFVGGSLIGILYQALRMPNDNYNNWMGAGALAVGVAVSMLFVVAGSKMNKE